jgi:nucleoside-diphosphate-sugar epimerase
VGQLPAVPDDRLAVAVTGATGTVGRGLLPLLLADPRVGRVIAISRRPWAPERDGLPGLEHRRADVRDGVALAEALAGSDVVVHLAFALYGVRQSEATLAAINVDGTRNAVLAASAVGARRFVATSSAAVYGFGDERAARVDETAAVAPERRHFYSRHKAAAEAALFAALAERPEMEWVVFRPCAVVGPHAIGAAAHAVPRVVAGAAGAGAAVAGSAGLRPPVPAPPVPVQFVHERDVGKAIVEAVTGPPRRAVYNLAGDGMVPGDDVPGLLGLPRLPVPHLVARAAVRLAAGVPSPWPALGWAHLLKRPLELDTARARHDLGWAPDFSSREALAATRRALAL